jgi:hypothetical protein
MPVTMTPSPESTKQTDRSTQELPEIPTVKDMRSWSVGKVLQWIQHSHPDILEDDDLGKFREAHVAGRAFLACDVEFYLRHGLRDGAILTLKDLADQIKEGGKFIPRT